MHMSIRVLDMFCGMSAFRSAAEKIGGFEFVGYCDNDPTAIAAYRILYNTEGEIYYDNARTVNTDEIPDFDLLVGGFPCVAFSAAGRRLAFKDERGTLFFELARILEAKRPAFFVFENVPPIRTIQKGQVFTAILSEISRLGYVCEWQCVDGSAYLPQSRKRVFIVGYLDSRCAGEILPLERKSGTPLSELTDKASQGNRVYDAKGAAITLTNEGSPKSHKTFWGEEEQRSERAFRCEAETRDTEYVTTSGGFGGKTGMYFVDMNENSKITDTARCITARHNAGLSNRKGEHSGVFVEDDGVYPVINPDREKIRQNGPRVRENGAPAFCITVVDRHGVMHKGRIRRLVPQECFRLMGFTDEQFFKLKNELGLVDSKLYKLAGNSIMVPILVDILSRIKKVNQKYSILKEEK